MRAKWKRRDFLQTVGWAIASFPFLTNIQKREEYIKVNDSRGIKQSLTRWIFSSMSLDQLCRVAKELGMSGVDLVGPDEWKILMQHGLECSMCNGAEISLTEGWNNKNYHAELIKRYKDHIDFVSAAGYKNLICFSGNRQGMDDETGLENCMIGLSQIMNLAEKKGVTIQMELFNSKIDHPDYMCDNSAWGIELCKRLGSPNFQLLYDIYHMQINEGDIIRTIRDYHPYFGHYHTAGVPGRKDLDQDQELNYPAIFKAIAQTGFEGYIAHEFIPKSDTNEGKIAAYKEAVQLVNKSINEN